MNATDPLRKRVRTIDEWNNLTEEEARKLSGEDTLRWLHAYEVRIATEKRRQKIKDCGTGAVGLFLAICQIVLALLLGLAALIVGLEVISLLLAALQGKPFVIKGHDLDNLQWGVLVLVVLGPIAYKARNYLDH